MCSASPREPSSNRPLADTNRNNESVTPNPRSPLDDYTLHIIHLETGKLCDRVHFKHDKIFLSHNQGLSLFKSTLAILSVQHQTLHMFHISDAGKFISVQEIGRTCYVDDDVFLRSCIVHDCPQSENDVSIETDTSSTTRRNAAAARGSSIPSSSSGPLDSSTSSLFPGRQAIAHSQPVEESGVLRSAEFRPTRVFDSNPIFHAAAPLRPAERSNLLVFPRLPRLPPRHEHIEGSKIIYSLKQKLVFELTLNFYVNI